jgi:hypothetical protein
MTPDRHSYGVSHFEIASGLEPGSETIIHENNHWVINVKHDLKKQGASVVCAIVNAETHGNVTGGCYDTGNVARSSMDELTSFVNGNCVSHITPRRSLGVNAK